MDHVENTLKKITVLVVDDMESIRSLINSCLKEIGVTQVAMATNGETAWNTLQKKSIDLILCDWDMPKVSGLELLNLIRSSKQHNHIPFLLLTAVTRDLEIIKLNPKELTADAFIKIFH